MTIAKDIMHQFKDGYDRINEAEFLSTKIKPIIYDLFSLIEVFEYTFKDESRLIFRGYKDGRIEWLCGILD